MIVVADTSPLNYLIQIECEYILPKLYRSVLVPDAVIHELQQASHPQIQKWLNPLPTWVQVKSVQPFRNERLSILDLGEREAIQLALTTGINTLLIDEQKGRRVARSFGLRTSGTLGALIDAHHYRFLDGAAAFQRLTQQTNFRIGERLVEGFYQRLKS